MSNGLFQVPAPKNEGVLHYSPDSSERAALKEELARQRQQIVEIPCVVNGQRIFTGRTVEITMPTKHSHVLARVHLAGPNEIASAIEGALEAKEAWAAIPWEQRTAVFLKAAELLTGSYRAIATASTMLGQGKTCHQAEIDVVCELADFWRFNASFAESIYGEQPPVSSPGVWNRLDHRPLDGFVFAISPFNFTSIALNLCTAPALMGNTAVWKPAITSALSCWYLYEMLEEAGLPPGVIQFIHGHGADVGDTVLAHPDLGGVHFTGSTPTFQHIWKTIGTQIQRYKQYPRIVGETGGKDFLIAHSSSKPIEVSTALLRGAFEYQGQKCSALSRAYLPQSLWPAIKAHLLEQLAFVKMGDVSDFSHFVAAVIDEAAFKKHERFLALAKESATIVAGGETDDREGWYVQPTVILVDTPKHRLMSEEIFGPILTIWLYPDAAWTEALQLVDETSPYALTGAVFATDRYAIDEATEALRFSAGNFYVNDKPTGAVVGQQPFGGGRASGTNDKAGSPLNLQRWISPRTIKETLQPAVDWRYPFLDNE